MTMSESEVDQQEVDQVADAPPEVDAPAGKEVDHGASREAARYRHRLRQAEAERDQVRDQLTSARQLIIEAELRRMTTKLDPSLLWLRATPDDFFDQEGRVNIERLSVIVDGFRERGAARVRGWNSGEGRGNPVPKASARSRAIAVIMGRAEE